MPADLKKILETLNEILQKLGAADKAVLEPYVKQMKDLVNETKESGKANLQANMEKLLALTEQIKEAKVGDLPGFQTALNMIQSTLREKLGKGD